MLRKISLGLIACVVATQTEALALYKAKLISHRESTTGEIKLVYKNAVNHARLMQTLPRFNPLVLASHVMSQQVVIGKPERIQSDGQYSIYNNTDVTQEYVVDIHTCVDKLNHPNDDVRCANTSDKFSLEPQGYVDESRMPELIMQFNDIKPQLLTTKIEVSQWSSDKPVYYVNSESSASIIVAATQGA